MAASSVRSSLAATLFALLVGAESGRSQDRPLALTYLGNMGVHLERGGQRVVIDGLHRGALAGYAAVPPHLLGPLEAAGPPFEALDLALTTHRHLDHFDPASVAARLGSDPAVWYLAARETVDALVAQSDVPPNHPRVLAALPPPEGGVEVSIRGIAVRVLDLPHNRTRSRRVANVGFLVTVGGATLLHVGDADPTTANFAPHRLPARGIDVAILPSWYFTDPGGAAVLEAIGARRYVASHVGLADSANVRRQLDRSGRQVILLATPGARIEIPIGRR
jgi:L-ascorbate metabolism protein UlaG (beta-lactamase superfamily)